MAVYMSPVIKSLNSNFSTDGHSKEKSSPPTNELNDVTQEQCRVTESGPN
uniref:Uncharacterized protein n=1 Tax=Arundo donax TaxID=35708 RepID=A0A0A9FK77_ARUDO